MSLFTPLEFFAGKPEKDRKLLWKLSFPAKWKVGILSQVGARSEEVQGLAGTT